MQKAMTGILRLLLVVALPLAGCSAGDGSIDPAESDSADPLAGTEAVGTSQQSLNGYFRILARRVSNMCLRREANQLTAASCSTTDDYWFAYDPATKQITPKVGGGCVGTASGTNASEPLAIGDCAGRGDQRWTFLPPQEVKISTFSTRTVQRIQNDYGLFVRVPDHRIGATAIAGGWSRSAYIDYDWMQLN